MEFEFCPNCDADLTLQKGYRNDLPRWECKGCGKMLINPDVESDITWICDKCGSYLNDQIGFDEDCEEWKCTNCGFVNKISSEEVFLSEAEYQSTLLDPYNGLSDKDVLELSRFEEIGLLSNRNDVILIKDRESGKPYVKKLLTEYDKSIYDYLLVHPIPHMPKVYAVYESKNNLIIIEDYIEGQTISELMAKDNSEDVTPIKEKEVLRIGVCLCDILKSLHNLPDPIVHRDIKPSNVIINRDGDVYLLDMNVAKWYKPDQTDDTKYLGTRDYAAPEQVGYGMKASSPKSDIYGLGILLNVMLTGKIPKEQKAPDRYWKIIEKCINLEADNRYSVEELESELNKLVNI